MSQVSGELPSDEDGDELTVEDVIVQFLRWTPNPSDEQVHNLAALCGISVEDFEAVIFRLFGDMADDDEDEDIDAEMNDDVEDQEELDPLDMFIITYFLRNPEPTDEQIHSLATVVGLEPDDLEDKIYQMMADSLMDAQDSELPSLI